MKATIVLLSFLLLAFGLCTAIANPIVERFFTELKLDPDGWKLEMHPSRPLLLNGWYLQSNGGRAYFKSGIRVDTGYVIITNDSLLTPLVINPLGDRLSINDSLFARAELTFGNAGVGVIAAPRPGQSLCIAPNISDYYWYLDNTPTLGRQNDFVNATGVLHGTVRDVSGFPVTSVQVYYHSWPDLWVYSDNAGRFTISDCARVENLRFHHPDYLTLSQLVQIWPETTITRNYTLIRTAAYPLHIGNRWNWGFEKTVTGDTLMPNGKRYAKMLDPIGTQFPYQRYENNKVHVYEFMGNIDQVVYDLSGVAPDTIATIPRQTDTMDIILTWNGETSLFGRTRRQWEFLFNMRRRIDEELYQVVTDSIGVTHEEGMWFSFNLVGAMINGVKYGTISDVYENSSQVPTEFKLEQNHPNPFNPTTTINYQLPTKSHVTLKVFDVLGREVATLVNEVQGLGFKKIEFDAGNLPAGRQGLASGVYLYRLQAGSFIGTRKMAVVK